MKRMLINATQEEELRMALVDGQRLYDLNIEQPTRERKKANIYKGKITRIEPSLEAAFIDYGADRHGFLPLKEISSEYFVNEAGGNGGRVNIRDVLREGQDIVVQIDKEERGNKGAALTTFVSLAGRFIVLKPNKPRSGGVSRRITGEDRDLARESLDQVDIPDGMSVILRTAGIERGPEELQWDFENLIGIWNAILKVVVSRPSPFLIYQERDAVIKALRDYMSNDIGEVLIDNPDVYREAREFVEQVMPHNVRKLKAYEDPVPLFTRYQIESQIESAFSHTVHLPSGGSVVIDHTEALISIDINSARATKGDDIESTAFNTNLEAADEIARQLRLRDLGGLIVIDFIDMGPQKNQRAVENRLREAVRIDRARVQIGKISRFGLLEMSRQRLRPSLGESSNEVCPRCTGMGNIRGVESLALAILRLVGEEARKERTSKVIAQLPTDVATYLLNEKREWVQSLEDRNDVQVVLIANPALHTPHYSIRRVRDDQTELPENAGVSYKLTEGDEDEPELALSEAKTATEQPAIVTVAPTGPAPPTRRANEEPQKAGLIVRMWRFFFAAGAEKPAAKKKAKKTTRTRSDRGTKRPARKTAKTPRRASEGKKSQARSKRPEKKADSGASAGKNSKRRRTPAKESQKESAADKPKDASDSTAANEDGAQPKKRRNRRSRGRRRGPTSTSSSDKAARETNETSAADGSGTPANETAATPSQQSNGRGNQAETATNKTDGPSYDAEAKPSAAASQGSAAAAPPPKDPAPKQADSAKKPSGERLLPWESAPPDTSAKNYTVWSSDGED